LVCSSDHLPAAITPVSSTIAAVAVPAATTAPTSTPTAPAAATAATAKAAPSTPATTTPAACRRPRFVDDDFPAHEVLAVQSLNGALGFFVAVDLDESEPAWLARETVAHQGHIRHGDSRLRKETAELLFRSLKRQITDVKFLQRKAPSGRGNADPRDRELKRAGS
jgi:hypothetical protein